MARKFIHNGDFHVYILECSDGSYYTGHTNDIARRLEEHTKGKGSKYTRCRRPVKLIWKKHYKDFQTAFMEEWRIKTLTRKQKEILINTKNNKVKGKKVNER